MTASSTLQSPEEEAAFRKEVAAFARANCPPEVRAAVARNATLQRQEYRAWQQALNARGWAAPGWPVKYGGADWDLRKRYVFEEVLAANDCPSPHHHSIGHIGPLLMEFGSAAQKARFLPGILDGSHWWCQGYSEPGSGSDLASIQTQAVRDGDGYVVNGKKVWTSNAHEADLMCTLVRTDAIRNRQQGVTLLLIPLDTPGISRRHIATIHGGHHINEVVLDNVRVPLTLRVGREGQAWGLAKYLLDSEQVGANTIAQLIQMLREVQRAVHAQPDGASQPHDRHVLEERVLHAEAELMGVRELAVRTIDDAMHGIPLGSRPSALKLKCSELSLDIIAIGMDAAGPAMARRLPDVIEAAPQALREDPNWMDQYRLYCARTIANSSSEILRNVIARELFGA